MNRTQLAYDHKYSNNYIIGTERGEIESIVMSTSDFDEPVLVDHNISLIETMWSRLLHRFGLASFERHLPFIWQSRKIILRPYVSYFGLRIYVAFDEVSKTWYKRSDKYNGLYDRLHDEGEKYLDEFSPNAHHPWMVGTANYNYSMMGTQAYIVGQQTINPGKLPVQAPSVVAAGAASVPASPYNYLHNNYPYPGVISGVVNKSLAPVDEDDELIESEVST